MRPMSDQTPNNKPEETLRDQALKASIWRNESEKGPFFTTTLARTYKDAEGNLKDTSSFRSQDLLRIAELAWQAHHVVGEMNREVAPERDAAREAFKDKRANMELKPPAHIRVR